MKRIFTLFFLLFLLSTTVIFGQAGTTIEYEDNLSNGVITLTYAGLVNGKHSYTNPAGSPGTFDDITITWSGTRWEITCCGILIAHSDAITVGISPPIGRSNPPGPLLWVLDDGASGFVVVAGSGATSVLPVELTNFIILKQDESLELKWQTASELNNEKFEIEMSQDGRSFQKIGEVKGNGTTSAESNYSFPIMNPSLGLSYYRLKQMDYDGQFEYSKILSANFEKQGASIGEIYPNPSRSGLVTLTLSAEEEQVIQVALFDVAGKKIKDQAQPLLKGNNELKFDFSAFDKGIYIVTIRDDKTTTSRKLILN